MIPSYFVNHAKLLREPFCVPFERVVRLTWWQVDNLYLAPAIRDSIAQRAEVAGQKMMNKADFMQAYRAKRPQATKKQCKQAWINYINGGL